MYTAMIIAACALYAAAFCAVMQLGGREAPRPGRGRITAVFVGLAVSGALLMTADSLAGGAPDGGTLWDTVLDRAPDYVPWMILITASITCGRLFFVNGSEPRDADTHTAVGTVRQAGPDHGPAGS